MNKSKQKICKIPGCNKEVFDSKSLLCGEHKREFQESIKKVGTVTVAGGGMLLGFISKYITNKKS